MNSWMQINIRQFKSIYAQKYMNKTNLASEIHVD